ncbi:MAG: C45 family autoproteolytic acyltransferase/hydrolase [Dehalococcoidia bacterium]
MSRKMGFGTLLALFAIVILTLSGNIQPVEAEPGNVIATYGQGYLEYVHGLPVLHVQGSSYEMGYQNGFLLKDNIQAQIEQTIQRMMDMGYSYEYMVDCAQAMEPHIPEEYIGEMQGLAEGAGMNYTDVLLAQLDAEIGSYGLGWTGCSGFAVFGNATVDGHLYYGRSLDSAPLHPASDPTGLVTVCQPENGNAFVSVGWFGLVTVATGISKERVTVGSMLSRSSDKTLDGTPNGFILKQVLQYSDSLTQAINIVNGTERTTGRNIVLGDGKNLNACAVEISASSCKVFWAGDPAEDVDPHYSIPNAIRRTNHYVDPELAATQRDPYDPRVGWNWSWDRYEKLSELIEDNYGNINAEMSIEFLRTDPVAWYPINFQSTVFDSTDLELWVACANSTTPAYEQEFIHLSRDILFPGFDLTISSTAGGNVTDPGEGTFAYDEGATVDLVAEPEDGYHFVEWTGDVTSIADAEDATTTITMEDDYEITANFEADAPGLCFIATAAYGTPMAEEIQILRDFRDGYLLTNPLGQAFVDFYYRVSPPIAEFITDHPSLKPIVRTGLLPAVAMSAAVLNTTPAQKAVMIGLLLLVSTAVAVWVMRGGSKGSRYT